MTKKRANGEGSVQRRKDGSWQARYFDRDGKRKSLYGRSHAAATAKLRHALKTRDDGLPSPSQSLSVGAFLEYFLNAVRHEVRHSTWVSYEGYTRLHVLPRLGRLPLVRLTPHHLHALYTEKLNDGLAPATVHHLHAFLHRALAQAHRWGVVAQNVAALASPPRIPKRRMVTLSAGEVRRLLDSLADDRLHALYLLAVTTGMRLGELLALRWADVGLDGRRLAIRGSLGRGPNGPVIAETKTGRERVVLLTRVSTNALKQHRVAQAKERLRAGDEWAGLDFVFTNEFGRPLDPSNVRLRSFRPALERAGLPRVRFHDLRHTAATLMLAENVHPKVVSEMLGHSQIGITLDLYSHVSPTMQESAVAALDALLGGV